MTRARDIADRNVDSTTIDGVDSTQLLRSDVADTKTAGDLSFADNVKARFGAGNDLQIYHDGGGSIIKDVGNGDLRVGATTNLFLMNGALTENLATFTAGGASTLYHNNSVTFATTSSGVDVTGSITASSDFILGSTSYGLVFGNTNGVNIRSASGKDTIFDNAGSERMRLTSGGNLGIGGTDIEAPLHVIAENSHGVNAIFGAKDFIDNASYNYDDANIALQGRDTGNNDTGAGIQFTVRNSGNTNWLHGYAVMPQDGSFAVGTGGAGTTAATERMRIDSSGNVGIGTASPTSGIDLERSGAASAEISLNQTGSGGRDFRISSTGTGYGSAGNLIVYDATGSAERMRIDSSGNLLVGTTDNNVTNNTGNNPGINIGVAGIKGYIAAARYQGNPLALNRLNNDGDIVNFSKDGTVIGSIDTQGGDSIVYQGGTTSGSGILCHGTGAKVLPARNGTSIDATIDLGQGSRRWRNIFLEDSLNFATSGTHGIAKANSDYGTIRTVGENGGWNGYCFGSKPYTLMSNGTHWGVFDDATNEWTLYFDRTNRYLYTNAEGSTTLRTNLTQGSCKCWISYNQETNATRDSYNISSITDNAVGAHTFYISDDMNNANYSLVAQDALDAGTGYMPKTSNKAVGSYKISVTDGGSADRPDLSSAVFGDIA